jgi:hypothetical protein
MGLLDAIRPWKVPRHLPSCGSSPAAKLSALVTILVFAISQLRACRHRQLGAQSWRITTRSHHGTAPPPRRQGCGRDEWRAVPARGGMASMVATPFVQSTASVERGSGSSGGGRGGPDTTKPPEGGFAPTTVDPLRAVLSQGRNDPGGGYC